MKILARSLDKVLKLRKEIFDNMHVGKLKIEITINGKIGITTLMKNYHTGNRTEQQD